MLQTNLHISGTTSHITFSWPNALTGYWAVRMRSQIVTLWSDLDLVGQAQPRGITLPVRTATTAVIGTSTHCTRQQNIIPIHKSWVLQNSSENTGGGDFVTIQICLCLFLHPEWAMNNSTNWVFPSFIFSLFVSIQLLTFLVLEESKMNVIWNIT